MTMFCDCGNPEAHRGEHIPKPVTDTPPDLDAIEAREYARRTGIPRLVAALRKAEAQVAAVLALCDRRDAEHAEYVRQIESGESYTLDRFIGPAQVKVTDLRAALDGAPECPVSIRAALGPVLPADEA